LRKLDEKISKEVDLRIKKDVILDDRRSEREAPKSAAGPRSVVSRKNS
jgi:hypothetical protein